MDAKKYSFNLAAGMYKGMLYAVNYGGPGYASDETERYCISAKLRNSSETKKQY